MNLKRNVSTAVVSAALLGLSSWANAIPTLQLGIASGTYDLSTETIIASNSSFSLYAYLIANHSNPIGDTYTISMAVSPAANSPASLGSFTVNGDAIHVTSGMSYGIPPLDATIETTPGGDSDDLQTHGVFPTFFSERAFSFSASDQTAAFNTEDNPSFGPQSGTGMYFKKFDIDVTNLDLGYAIHFDFYNTKALTETICEDRDHGDDGDEGDHGDDGKKGKGKSDDDEGDKNKNKDKDKDKECTTILTGELDITEKAPFSHDAQSGPGGGGDDGDDGGGNEVPEPASMLLLGLGLFGLGWTRRKAR